LRILISAGEASGEMYGAQLIRAMQRHAATQQGTAPVGRPGQPSSPMAATPLEFFGVGGEKMRAAGCDTIVDAKDLAVVGISEILGHLPKIWRLFHRLLAEAGKRRPGLAIVIDSPAFNWRVARQMKKRGIPVVYYVCPQFWAWRQGRVRLLRNYVDKALVIFPFEEKFYRDRGLDATFVGHPLAGLPKPAITREAYAAKHRLDPAKPWITLMPGSRVKEVRMNLPTIMESAAKLGGEYEFLLPVAPTLERSFLTSLVGSQPIHLVSESWPALAHSRAGIIASGTATVEGAMMGTPFVMVYRVTAFTYFVGRRAVKVPHFAMVNLIAGKEIVPELVQHDFTVEKVVARLQEIIADGPARDRMILGLQEVRDRLGHSDRDQRHPADQASDAIFKLMGD
jgi:lipid-A-disaccharide synthase